MTFSAIVERALRCAVEAHAGQKRKDSEGSPYIVHSIHVALTLVRWGAEAEAVAAGLLHDVVEDCAEKGWSRERMEEEFGERVAGIVAEVTEDKRCSWEERKQAQLDHVPGLSEDALAVKAADLLHNMSSLAMELEANGADDGLWDRFSRGREGTLWFGGHMVAALGPRVAPAVSEELSEALDRLSRAAGL
jgi:(p)ppGpp synthase/HD superfamily hydrolase